MYNIFFLKKFLELVCNAFFLQWLLVVHYHFYISCGLCLKENPLTLKIVK